MNVSEKQIRNVFTEIDLMKRDNKALDEKLDKILNQVEIIAQTLVDTNSQLDQVKNQQISKSHLMECVQHLKTTIYYLKCVSYCCVGVVHPISLFDIESLIIRLNKNFEI